MPFGKAIISFLGGISVDDHLAPRVVSDFTHDLPPNPIRGAAVSDFVHDLYPIDPIHPTALGAQLSDYIGLFGPDGLTPSDTWLF